MGLKFYENIFLKEFRAVTNWKIFKCPKIWATLQIFLKFCIKHTEYYSKLKFRKS